MKTQLSNEQIGRLSSPYLAEGRKSETWEICDVEIDEYDVNATVRMVSTYESPTDAGGFHLTSFAVLEFISQLFVIHGHVLAGLEDKSREGWMLESSVICKKAIRDPNNIQVRMHLDLDKKTPSKMLGTTTATITDNQGGLFETTIRALLA